MKSKILIIVFLLSLSSCNFKGKPAPFDKDFNNTRKKVGLRIVDSTFQNNNVPDNYDFTPLKRKIYGLPIFLSEIKKPMYVEKLTYMDRNNGKIIYEEDKFVSGVSKAGVDENIVENLILRYVFKDYTYFFKKSDRLGGDINEKFTEGWHYIYTYPRYVGTYSNKPDLKYYKSETKMISEKETDSILKSWNLKRLNY